MKSIDAVFNVWVGEDDGKEIRYLPETGGGAFMDLGCYPLSWALMIMDSQPETVEANADLTHRGVDETMTVVLTFSGGATARLQSSFASGQPFKAKLTVEGELGRIQFDNPLAPHNGGKLILETENGAHSGSISKSTTYSFMMNAVAEGLKSETFVHTDGDTVLHQQRTLDRIYEAAGLRHLRYR